MNLNRGLKRFINLILNSLFILTFAGALLAQSGTSRISGIVTDPNDAAVAGATVRISNPATGFSRTVTTGEDGAYSFPGIPPATYRLEVEAPGFKKLVNTNVQALVDTSIEINGKLEAGDVSAVVDVTTNTIDSVVNTQDAALGNNFVPRQITQLPTDLRRVADLLTLQPGVTREGYVAGGRSDQANILLDGIDINDQQNGGRTEQFQTTQETVLRATAESVEEFRITTTNPNANQGRSSGAQISLVTKSGTNDWHGSVFYFYRPTAGSANTFFNNAAGRFEAGDQAVLDGTAAVGDERAPRPSLSRDVFGGAIGGPIVKDRFFFFYTYEGQRELQQLSVVRVVPLPHLGLGQIRFSGTGPSCVGGQCVVGLAELNNSIYPEVGINPLAMNVLADASSRYTANDTSVGDGVNTGGFRFNAPTSTEENTHIARFDFKINDRQSLYTRLNYQQDILTGASNFPDTPSTTLWEHPKGFMVGHDWAIGSNRVNNFRYGFTRQAFSQQGDSSDNAISFRFVYSPLAFVRTLSRVTPVHNITDDFTWIKGNHTWQFGGNVRIIRNQRVDFGNAFDDAVTNPSFYNLSGAVVTNAFTAAGYSINPGDRNTVQAAATALIGRYSQYSGNFTFDLDGSVLPPGTPTNRNFATEEYDAYVQDIWKVRPDLTLTLGLRYGVSRPVYETEGFQVVPDEPLGDFFARRQASALTGVPLNDLIQFIPAGPANNAPGFYETDWNNFQPRLAAAWSPYFGDSGFARFMFGNKGDTVIRGGFAITNDHFGGQLAVSFDGLSPIGFTSAVTISANTYDITNCGSLGPTGLPRCAPQFTGFNQDIRSLPGIPAPSQRFETDADEAQRIETSLDATITTPTHYSWNVTWGRQLPKGMYLEASYVGRKARNLLAAQDVMALNNLVDPVSKMDWYTAAGMLHDARAANVPINSQPAIPYFENLFPNAMAVLNNDFGFGANNNTQAIYSLVSRDGFDILDWTFVQLIIDDATAFGLSGNPGLFPNMFFHPQYAAFSSFSSVARSDYNGLVISLRQRLGDDLTWDFNYTFSQSKDNASGLQTGTSYGSQFILNPLRPMDNYALSDFDTRHSINANFIWQLPFGRGKAFGSDASGWVNAIIGGWQLAGIIRYNTGLPVSAPIDAAQWATNWNVQSSGTRIAPIEVQVDRRTQNMWADPQAAFNSFRNARPGETGERNVFRLPGYSTVNLGLSKTFDMPWSEGHKLALRWEVNNVMNIQYFNGDNFTRSTFGLPQDPETGTAASDFGKIFSSIQGTPRRMQFGLRYSF
ncbi:MAG TPA: TonB-dependent receptor [Pyrinomonadaceae bacterium]|nr:TonB-dependent receptor [Pyrinomonadaceae bacterium]